MPWSLDARIPVHLGAATPPAEDDAFLMENAPPTGPHPAERFVLDSTGHPQNCACCVARSPAAVALDRLFQRRVRGEVGFFRRVIAVTTSPEGDLAVWTALRDDPVVSARFRLAS